MDFGNNYSVESEETPPCYKGRFLYYLPALSFVPGVLTNLNLFPEM
jgi:hypothetical protein